MIYPSKIYEIDTFKNSNPGCPITEITLEPVASGAPTDLKSKDGA